MEDNMIFMSTYQVDQYKQADTQAFLRTWLTSKLQENIPMASHKLVDGMMFQMVMAG